SKLLTPIASQPAAEWAATVVAVDMGEGEAALVQADAEAIGESQAQSRPVDLGIEVGKGAAAGHPGTGEDRDDLGQRTGVDVLERVTEESDEVGEVAVAG